MSYLEIKNAIDSYNLKAQSFRRLFEEFDFRGFLKSSTQMMDLHTYQLLEKYNPGAVPEVKSMNNYNSLESFYSAHLSSCFSERFDTTELNQLTSLYESIPKQYRNLLTGWQPNDAELNLIHRVISEQEFFLVQTKERFLKYKNQFLEAVLAKSLPNMNEEDIRGLIGTNILTEDKLKEFIKKGILSETANLSLVYEALGIEQPVVINKDSVKVVGTTYRTKSGELRQELIAQLNESAEKASLSLVPYIFQKEGQPDVNAVAVYWNNEDIANLSQTTVDAIYEQIENPRFELLNYEIIGGYSANSSFGIKVSFRATGVPKIKEEEINTNQSLVVGNPMNI